MKVAIDDRTAALLVGLCEAVDALEDEFTAAAVEAVDVAAAALSRHVAATGTRLSRRQQGFAEAAVRRVQRLVERRQAVRQAQRATAG